MAHFRAVARVGRVRHPATDVPDEWSSPVITSVTMGTEPGLQTAWRLLYKNRTYQEHSSAALLREEFV